MKNGYGRMVILSMKSFEKFSGNINAYIADADYNPVRLTHD